MTEPTVSVLMSVYNGADWLKESIPSVLRQTRGDFEFIIINDGSNDRTEEAVKSFNDPRIIYHSQPNQGLARTLNRAIRMARGRFLARMDHDDVAHPERFASQVAYLNSNPETVLLGSWARILVSDQVTERTHRHPVGNAEIRFFLLFDNPFVHSSVMLRADAVRKVGFYTEDPARQPPEDYELWSRLARIGQVANIGKFLQDYREVPTSICRTSDNSFEERIMLFSRENLAYWSGMDISDPVIDTTARLHRNMNPSNLSDVRFDEIASLLDRAAQSIRELGPSDDKMLVQLVQERKSYLHQQYLRSKYPRFFRLLGRIENKIGVKLIRMSVKKIF